MNGAAGDPAANVVDEMTCAAESAGGSTLTDAEPPLLPPFASFDADVETLIVVEPACDGVPDTVQTIEAPTATLAGGCGLHEMVRPEGSPVTEHVAFAAAADELAELVHRMLPA